MQRHHRDQRFKKSIPINRILHTQQTKSSVSMLVRGVVSKEAPCSIPAECHSWDRRIREATSQASSCQRSHTSVCLQVAVGGNMYVSALFCHVSITNTLRMNAVPVCIRPRPWSSALAANAELLVLGIVPLNALASAKKFVWSGQR